MTEQNELPESPMQAAFRTHKESLSIVGDTARGSRARIDTLAFAAWIKRDLVASSKLYDEACTTHLSVAELEDSYSKSVRAAIKAVMFSLNDEVRGIAEAYGRGQYVVGIKAAADKARGRVARVTPIAGSTPSAPEAPAATPAVSVTNPVPVLAQIEALLDSEFLTLAELQLIAESVARRITAKQSQVA